MGRRSCSNTRPQLAEQVRLLLAKGVNECFRAHNLAFVTHAEFRQVGEAETIKVDNARLDRVSLEFRPYNAIIKLRPVCRLKSSVAFSGTGTERAPGRWRLRSR